MKILIISKFFPPENAVGGLRPSSWAKYWSAAGHEVQVLTTPKEPSDAVSNEIYKNYEVIEIEIGGVYLLLRKFYRKFIKSNNQMSSVNKIENKSGPHQKNFMTRLLRKCWNYLVSRGLNTSSRMPDPTDFWIKPASNWALAQNKKWDLIISTFGPYSCHLIAKNIKKKSPKTFWIADFRDIWTLSHVTKGIPPFTLLENILEKSIMKKADLITIVSDPLTEQLSLKYPKSNIATIENGFDLDDLKQLPKENIFEDKSKLRILYTGSIYEGKRDPSPLFEAIKNIKEIDPILLKNFEVHFIGPNMKIIEHLAAKYDIEEYIILGANLPRMTALQMQRDTDILLFLEVESPNIPGILTGKLFEYLNSTSPIWAVGVSNKTISGKLIEDANAGIAFGKDVKLIQNRLQLFLTEKTIKPVDITHSKIKYFDRCTLAMKILDNFNIQNRELD